MRLMCKSMGFEPWMWCYWVNTQTTTKKRKHWLAQFIETAHIELGFTQIHDDFMRCQVHSNS